MVFYRGIRVRVVYFLDYDLEERGKGGYGNGDKKVIIFLFFLVLLWSFF